MGRKFTLLLSVAALSGCATTPTVRQSDLDAWVGRPVADLDKHPVFLTLPVVTTRAADGTEIRNYVNGKAISTCAGGGSAMHYSMPFTAYNNFSTCMQTNAACNNIFYINNGQVTRFTPIGTGGGKCFTNDTLLPGFSGAANM